MKKDFFLIFYKIQGQKVVVMDERWTFISLRMKKDFFFFLNFRDEKQTYSKISGSK